MMYRYSRGGRLSAGQGFEKPAPQRVKTTADIREIRIRIVLLALLLYAAGCLASAERELAAADAQAAALREALALIEAENRTASQCLAGGWSAEELEALARERLGLVLPGDRIYRFVQADPGSLP